MKFPPPVWNALIRTHHITSRKKVADLTQSAKKHEVYALLRSGSSPGIMYVEGAEMGVKGWVADCKRLRYKDWKLISRPAEAMIDGAITPKEQSEETGLHELNSVKDFGAEMQKRAVLDWWRKAMAFDTPPDRL